VISFQRLGFVRLALKHGVELLPAYIFGENQVYGTYGATGRAISAFAYRYLGVPLVPVRGWGLPLAPSRPSQMEIMAITSSHDDHHPTQVRGRWGLPWLVPKACGLHVCWGRPVHVGDPNAEPSEADVMAVFQRYVAELRRVFDENKAECLPPDVAKRSLTMRMYSRDGHVTAMVM